MPVFWLATLLGIAQRFVSSRHPVEGLSGWFRSRHCSRIARHLRPQQRIAVVDPGRDLDDRASADDRRNWEPLVNCDRRCNHNRACGAPHPALGGQWPPIHVRSVPPLFLHRSGASEACRRSGPFSTASLQRSFGARVRRSFNVISFKVKVIKGVRQRLRIHRRIFGRGPEENGIPSLRREA